MPGICGIVSKAPREENGANLRLMLECMMHEPFYTSGSYVNDQIGVYAGWVCHEGSFADCMPVWNEKKNIVLLFFGETFSDFDLFDQLKAKHHRFDNTNASYIVHLYEEKGLGFVEDLNGWFSGLLIDTKADRAFLFNDRYGMQKVFYYEHRDSFCFSSEAKSLLRIRPELREIDLKGLGEFLTCDCVLENRTLFKDIFLLPGASAWTLRENESPVKSCYFNPEVWESQPWLEKEYFYERVKETFRRILPRYFRGNQKIGVSLTGGLDTRVIMANAELPPGKYPCYTFGGMYRECYDVKVARKIAEKCNQNHQVLPLNGQFLSEFPKHAEKTVYISDGYAGVSGAYEVYLNKLAREIAPVRMTGNYGGEVLRDIRGMLKARPLYSNLFDPQMEKDAAEASRTLAGLHHASNHPVSFNLFKEIPWFRNNGFASEQSQVTPRSPYLDNDLVALIYRAPIDARGTLEMSLRLIADGNPLLSHIPTDRGFGGDQKFPLSALLRSYYEFTFKAEYAYNYGMPQWLARIDHAFMRLHLERLFFGRHKFAHFRTWYRDELAAYVKQVLLDEGTLNRPYLKRKKVEEIVLGHTKGDHNYTTEISKMLTFELIIRLLIENR